MAFHDIFSDLFFFEVVGKDIDFIERAVFQGYIEPIKSAAVVRAFLVVDFFEVFADYSTD